jgi:hypothetical protein
MAEGIKDFYDQLASNYHLIFEDWEASIYRQAAILGAILERECGPPASVRSWIVPVELEHKRWVWPGWDFR